MPRKLNKTEQAIEWYVAAHAEALEAALKAAGAVDVRVGYKIEYTMEGVLVTLWNKATGRVINRGLIDLGDDDDN